MKNSIQQLAETLTRRTRRALAALIVSGSIVSSLSFGSAMAHDSAELATMNADPAEIELIESPAANALDHWIFRDDYCGWASAEPLIAPFRAEADTLATSPPADGITLPSEGVLLGEGALSGEGPHVKVVSRNALEEALLDLAKREPIDVNVPAEMPAASPEPSDSHLAVSLTGSAPVIVSIAEGYLPYDISRADLIGLRMYPMAMPQFGYVGLQGRSGFAPQAWRSPVADQMGPMDCLGYGVVWNDEALPAETVMTVPTAPSNPTLKGDTTKSVVPIEALSHAMQSVGSVMLRAANQAQSDDRQRQSRLARHVVNAVQPGSPLRQSMDPVSISRDASRAVLGAYVTAESQLPSATNSVANSWPADAPDTNREEGISEERILTAGEQLLVRAGIEANAMTDATADVAELGAESECCPVERTLSESEPPATQSLATVGIATATLQMPQPPNDRPDDLDRAKAIATAFDSAAATLENLAQKLRNAGNSVVRVARASAGSQPELR